MSEDTRITRRDFLRRATGASLGLAAAGGVSARRVLGGNDGIDQREERKVTKRITVKQHLVFSGRGEYKLACGAMIAQATNGDLLCSWLSGGDKEPATDNCILMSRSEDGGHTWGEAEVLLPAGEMASGLTSMHSTSDGRLIAFGAGWPSEKQYTEWHYFRMESKDSAHTWGPRQPMVLHGNHGSTGSPIRLTNGELLFAGSFFDERPQPLVAPVTRLCEAATEEEALAMPAEPGKPTAGKFATHLHGCSVYISPDENVRTLTEYGHIANRPLGLLEPSCVQLRDGRIVMFMRAEWGGFLWRSESRDNGRTWTPAVETEIPNPTTKADILRLADGRIALLHNATGGRRGERGVRNPLSIWVSDDELQSWSIREDVIATSGNYRPANWRDGPDQLAYPCGIVLGRRLAFVYDRNRRDVLFVKVEISA